ncbi:MAG: hypothetical protein JW888_07705, partial [Pirellulales bacterium]|nr:hypothetical protein [Pirellulales bacterium]
MMGVRPCRKTEVTGVWTIALMSAVIALAAPAARGTEVSTDATFLDGLRRRELFELAETYCRQRLANPSLSSRDRAELTIQAARTLTEHAAGAPSEQRAALWRQARQTLDAWLAAEPDSPWKPLVALQRALVALARGELARQQSEVAADREPWLAEAKDQLRDAVGRLRALTTEVDQMLTTAQRASTTRPSNRSGRDQPKMLSIDELISLGRHLRFELARAWMSQARSYNEASADRAHGLTQAVRLLDELAGLPDDPLIWKSRLSRATCYRLLSDYAAAEQALASIAQQHAPAAVALKARAEAVRLALARNQIDQAVGLLQVPNDLAQVDSPDWDFARLEACLAAWHAASDARDSAAAESWQTRASQLVRQIEARHGAYWTHRAEMLLAGHFHEAGDLDTRVRAAKIAYLNGQLDTALTGYDRAAALAAEQGDAAAALDLGYLAAMIVQKQGHHRQAFQRCRRLALAATSQPKAPAIHVEAIRNMAQSVGAKSDDALDAYVELLEEHLRTWPGASTTSQVLWWLGGVRRYQRDWERAIAAYRAISPADERFAGAVDAVGQSYAARIAELTPDAPTAQTMAVEAAKWFESLLQTPEGRLPERISPAQRNAVLWAARLRLQSSEGGYDQARRVLTVALRAANDAPDEWRQTAQTLLVAALAGGGQIDQAREILKQLSAAGVGPLVEVIDELQRIGEGRPT